MARDKFANYSLEVGGLVKTQLHLTLADLRAMPKQTQITKHCCIQGYRCWERLMATCSREKRRPRVFWNTVGLGLFEIAIKAELLCRM